MATNYYHGEMNALHKEVGEMWVGLGIGCSGYKSSALKNTAISLVKPHLQGHA